MTQSLLCNILCDFLSPTQALPRSFTASLLKFFPFSVAFLLDLPAPEVSLKPPFFHHQILYCRPLLNSLPLSKPSHFSPPSCTLSRALSVMSSAANHSILSTPSRHSSLWFLSFTVKNLPLLSLQKPPPFITNKNTKPSSKGF